LKSEVRARYISCQRARQPSEAQARATSHRQELCYAMMNFQ
jgi:hypothetical protein